MKLLAKAPRTGTRARQGLAADLGAAAARMERAPRRWRPSPLGQHDVPDRFVIPQQLYGREREVARLSAAFDRVVPRAAPELVLVAGYSGVGKTSLVHEIYKSLIAAQRGHFIAGKFDQLTRDIPYAPLVQAFRGLVRQLLTESDERGSPRGATRLAEALGAERPA